MKKVMRVSETLLTKALVVDSVINGARREQRRSAKGIGEANGQYVSYGMGVSLTVLQLGYIKTSSWTEQVGIDAGDNKTKFKYEGEVFK